MSATRLLVRLHQTRGEQEGGGSSGDVQTLRRHFCRRLAAAAQFTYIAPLTDGANANRTVRLAIDLTGSVTVCSILYGSRSAGCGAGSDILYYRQHIRNFEITSCENMVTV
jgi:hypothetical protein